MNKITKLSEVTYHNNVEILTKEEYDKIVQIVRNSDKFVFQMLSSWESLQENKPYKSFLHSFSNKDEKLSISWSEYVENSIFTPASYFIKNYQPE